MCCAVPRAAPTYSQSTCVNRNRNGFRTDTYTVKWITPSSSYWIRTVSGFALTNVKTSSRFPSPKPKHIPPLSLTCSSLGQHGGGGHPINVQSTYLNKALASGSEQTETQCGANSRGKRKEMVAGQTREERAFLSAQCAPAELQQGRGGRGWAI